MQLYLDQSEVNKIFKSHIKTSVYSLSLKTLFGDRMTRKIDYNPYYQRNYVWDTRKASFFIESILLGTDIPPLIFFNSGSRIEVIDGRQRYETIKKFREGEIKLNIKGLTKLTKLKNQTFSKLDSEIQSLFDDAKIRIFEFEVINEPKIDSTLEDKIKKEIFRRYNSGITPLNSAELDNASYDSDELTNILKEKILKEENLFVDVNDLFIGKHNTFQTSKILELLRRYLVLTSFPIRTYANGSNRAEILKLLYDVRVNNTEDIEGLCNDILNTLRTSIDFIKKIDVEKNKYLHEVILWAIFVLKEEEKNIDLLNDNEIIQKIKDYIKNNLDDFYSENSHYYKSIITRHNGIGKIFGKIFQCNYSKYLGDEGFKNEVAQMRQSEKETKLKLGELSSMRVQKPEPSLIPIEEITSELSTRKYLIRPSYQRQEKININKSSSIIESIILGINLPPLFLFKNKDGVREVIDGQQRLLSILAFLGKNYVNEIGKVVYPKNNGFKLTGLKILKEFNKKNYSDLNEVTKDKILDFRLSIIEIDSNLNVNFDPVDLFIRLNNKPYPIKENSFEMWNSFIDKDVIQSIKNVSYKYKSWFYLKKDTGTDRMLNEELIALLSYIIYNKEYRSDYRSLSYHLRDNKITCRLSDKKDISLLLEKISTDIEAKNFFLGAIQQVEDLIKFLQSRLNNDCLVSSLNNLFGRETTKRYLVDFYILFQILQYKDQINDFSASFLKQKMEIIKYKMNNPEPLTDGAYQQYIESIISKEMSDAIKKV